MQAKWQFAETSEKNLKLSAFPAYHWVW